MANNKGSTTRTRLLDHGEELFARFGYNGVSVRDIASSAQVNLGAIPYHFTSKEALFKEILTRRAGPLREERRRQLELLRQSNPNPQLEDILYALLEPGFRTNRENDAFRRLLGRASTDPSPQVRKLLKEIYTLDFMTVPNVLQNYFAGMDETEFYWKLNCFYGVMMFVQADTGKIQTIAGDDFDTANPEAALRYVIPFLGAGMRTTIEFKPPHPKPPEVSEGSPEPVDAS